MEIEPELDAPELLARLTTANVRFFIIGGFASILHGTRYVTEDLDVCASMEEGNVAKIFQAIRDIDPRVKGRPDRMPFPFDTVPLAGWKNIYLATRFGEIDILGEVPNFGSFVEIEPKTVEMEIEGSVCKVIDLDTLIEVKRRLPRPKDKLVLRQLEVIREIRKQQGELF